MTLRLILMRHAKSAWDTPASGDHDRPLNDRGRRSARAIGAWLNEKGYLPDPLLSSDSKRTRETWALVEGELARAPGNIVWLRELYLAPAQTMLDVLRTASSAQTVMMLGHNPGSAGFANMIVGQAPEHSRFRDYPTAATTVIEFDAEGWASVDWGTGSVQDFVIPRDL